MPNSLQSLGIDRLSVEERILLVQEIWDSIVDGGGSVSLTAEQENEIDRRLAAHQADPKNVIPWEKVQAMARERLQQ